MFNYRKNKIKNRSRLLEHIDRRNSVDDIDMRIGEIKVEKNRENGHGKIGNIIKRASGIIVKGKENEDIKTLLRTLQTKINKKRHTV